MLCCKKEKKKVGHPCARKLKSTSKEKIKMTQKHQNRVTIKLKRLSKKEFRILSRFFASFVALFCGGPKIFELCVLSLFINTLCARAILFLFSFFIFIFILLLLLFFILVFCPSVVSVFKLSLFKFVLFLFIFLFFVSN